MNVTIKKRLPTAAEYNGLRRLAEWPVFDVNLVERGLANCLHSVVAEDDEGMAVGMGRVIGDNAIYFHIQDVIVRPEFQRHGVGKLIMNELLRYVEANGGKNTNVGLMCSKGREPFYQAFGFIERPNDKFGSGMIKIMA
jgi:GNAT superfamily N-acetyltransferase